MEIDKAIEILTEYIKLDRDLRDVKDYSIDFDKFCEEKCIAIERVLNEVEALKAWKNYGQSVDV